MLELQGVAADLVALQSLDPVKVAPMPKEAFEFGMKSGNLLDREGGWWHRRDPVWVLAWTGTV